MDVLRRIVAEHGTPAYAYDIGRIRRQVERVQQALPTGAGLLYSLKANPNLSITAVMAAHGVGADAASGAEIATALAAASEGARRDGVPGAVVLLSPACASYDQFPNFEVRGDTFRDMVQKLRAEAGA